MPLKNKDGTPYKLSGPNPVLSDMALWAKKEKLILHNIGGKLVSHEESQVIYRNSEPEIVEALPTPSQQPVKAEPTPDPMDTVEIEAEIPILDSLDGDPAMQVEGKVQVWCQPAYFRQYKDDLTGETYSRPRYGEKFLFEAVIEDMGDMHLVLYTTTDAITEGSVIFPRTHDKRWWRVVETKKGDDGLIRIYGGFTDFHPDFS